MSSSKSSRVRARKRRRYGADEAILREVSDVLRDFGIDMDAERLKRMYRNKAKDPKDGGITFSQLARRTERYFANSASASSASEDLAARNMTLKGQFLGSRAQGSGVASKNSESVHVSDFLAHHDSPTKKARRRARVRSTSSKLRKSKEKSH